MGDQLRAWRNSSDMRLLLFRHLAARSLGFKLLCAHPALLLNARVDFLAAKDLA